MNAQPHSPQKQSNTSQLDLAQLVSRANHALEQDDPDSAVHYLRAAVQRAPLRGDLRDALFTAIGRQKLRRSPGGPRPMPKPAQPPLFDNPMHEEDARAHIEEVPRPQPKSAQKSPACPSPSSKRPLSETGELFGQDDFLAKGPASSRSNKERPVPMRGVSASGTVRPARKPGEARVPRVGAGQLFGTPRPRQGASFARVALYVGTGVLTMAMVAAGAFFVLNLRTSGDATPEGAPLSQAQRDDAVLLARAEDYLKERQFTLAFEQIEKMSDKEAKAGILARTYGLQAEEFFSGKRYEEARRVYAKAAESEPGNDLWQFQIGWCSYMLGLEKRVTNRQAALELFAQAEAAFKDAVRINPNQVKALHGLGKVEVARNNRPAANEYYQKVLQIAPDSPEAMLAKGDLQAWGLDRSRPASAPSSAVAQPASAVAQPAPPAEEAAATPATKAKVKTEMTALKTKL